MKQAVQQKEKTPPVAAPEGKAAFSADVLARECRIFTRYLIGQEPGAYVIQKYCDGHAAAGPLFMPAGWLERLLLAVARTYSLGTRLVDSYTRFLLPDSAARKKMILLIAILESCAPTYLHYEETDVESRVLLLLHLCGWGAVSVASLLLSLVLFLPLYGIETVGRRLSGRERS